MFPTRRLVTTVLLGALLGLSTVVPAAAGEAEDLLGRINGRYRKVSTLRAEFVQRERVASLGRIRESRGVLLLKKPGKMRWDYTAPEKHLIVSDGQILWMYYPEEKNAYRLTFADEDISMTPLAILFRADRDMTDFFTPTTVTPLKDGLTRVDLKPKAETDRMTSIALIARSSDGTLYGVIHKDAFGNITEVDFQKIVESPLVEDRQFVFTPPAGTKIMTSRYQSE
jgi:outer membrane lipoprotein carrier protein